MQSLSNEFPHASALRFNTKRVLIADDEIVNRRIHAKFVEKYNKEHPDEDQFVATVAVDGEDALAKIQEAQKAGTPFDVLITDNSMPNKTGMELLKSLTEGRPYTAMISSDLVEAEARTSGANHFYAKPSSFKNFQEIFTQFQKTPHAQPATAPASLPVPKPSDPDIKNLRDRNNPFERAFAKHQREEQE